LVPNSHSTLVKQYQVNCLLFVYLALLDQGAAVWSQTVHGQFGPNSRTWAKLPKQYSGKTAPWSTAPRALANSSPKQQCPGQAEQQHPGQDRQAAPWSGCTLVKPYPDQAAEQHPGQAVPWSSRTLIKQQSSTLPWSSSTAAPWSGSTLVKPYSSALAIEASSLQGGSHCSEYGAPP
jgi:hypothetical protein